MSWQSPQQQWPTPKRRLGWREVLIAVVVLVAGINVLLAVVGAF